MAHTLSPLWNRALEGTRYFRTGRPTPPEDPGRSIASGERNSGADAQIRGTRRRVLIVEDDPALQKAMIEHVAQMGLDVMIASHYDAARAHLASGTPDLVCVDIGLPTQSGHELCEYIRGPLGLRRLPIMVTSDFGSPADIAHAEEAGANAFLVKRFSMLQFGNNVAALLAGAPVVAQLIHGSGTGLVHRTVRGPFAALTVVGRPESAHDARERRHHVRRTRPFDRRREGTCSR
jgi:DNA-binding response OmpR family regulator